MPDQPWDDINLKQDSGITREIGNVSLGFRKNGDEVWITSQDASKIKKAGKESEKDLIWSRWVLKNDETRLSLLPLTPDHPVVVVPEYAFRLVRNATARIYVRIPLWIGIVSSDGSKLTEVPSVTLTKTWFGNAAEGELCYGISTTARRNINNEDIQPFQMVCTINIHNKSKEDLQVEKICFRVERLSIFLKDNCFWSDETDINYHGEQQHSDISMTGKVPREAKGGKKITDPRNPAKRSLTVRTFKILKDLPLSWD